MVNTRQSREVVVTGSKLRPPPALEEEHHGGQPTGKNRGQAKKYLEYHAKKPPL
jgi:hypothetical protein